MIKSLRFNSIYFLLTLFIFGIEVLIATVLKDWFWVRAYLGDVIVVFLLYTFVLTFFRCNKLKLIIGLFVFSVLVEGMQFFHVATLLGFEKGSLPYIIIGNSFSWVDILCYAIGCLLLYGMVKLQNRNSSPTF